MSERHSPPEYTFPSTTSHPIMLDPSAPGTVMRYAIATEAFFNLLGAIPMLFSPRSLLLLISASQQPSPLAISLTQWLGALVLGLTAPLVLAYPNTRRGLQSRPTVYWTLGTGEAALVVVLVWQYLCKREGSGMSGRFLMGATGMMTGLCAWRLWVLTAKREWMGRYNDSKKRE
ncbi:hypothetical protein MMC13_005843 [Lambiella insularis]|nr:hypothetical protein [Lambiella insularis]